MKAIETSLLTKYYGTARGIIDVSLTVEEGECFGFIGPNGAGKSTTIRTLLGLIGASSGTATIFGKSIKTQDGKNNKTEILNEIGYLPSEAIYYSNRKVKDIIKLSADLRKKDCSTEAEKLGTRLQLDTNKRVSELSFGNKKKLGIVCALQSNPRLLILDEPTSGLDPLMQHEFFDIIRERNKQGTTVFLSSHILSEVQNNCTKAAIIREGKIIAFDSVENLAKTNAKRIAIVGSVDVSTLDGVKDLSEDERTLSFLYSGEMQALIQRLASGKVLDLKISEVELEEIFLHYYQGTTKN